MSIWLLVVAFAYGLILPEQISLSWTERPSEVRVTWISIMSIRAEVYYRPILCSSDSSFIQMPVTSTRHDYGTNFVRYQYLNTCVLTNITQECQYEYYVSNGFLSSKVFTFNGRTPFIENNDEFSVIVLGDLGVSKASQGTIDAILDFDDREKLIGLFHLGDIAYDLQEDEGRVGDRFGHMVQDLATFMPYMLIPGNHDLVGNYSQYKKRYIMPKNDMNQGSGLFYSIDIGYVHFVLVNTNVYLIGSEIEQQVQIDWLISDLNATSLNREKTPWVVVLAHHPLYCSHEVGNTWSENDCIRDTRRMRGHFEEIYHTYKVDLVITGHMHNYERNSAIYNDTLMSCESETTNECINPRATIHIITGNGGNDRGKSDPIVSTPRDWQVLQLKQYGFGMVTSFNSSHLLWQQFNSETRELADHLLIVKI